MMPLKRTPGVDGFAETGWPSSENENGEGMVCLF